MMFPTILKATYVTTATTVPATLPVRKNRTVFFPGVSGFTLLELIVAIAIFSLLSVMAYSGLMVMLQTASQTEQQAKRMTELQMAMMIVSRDMFQATSRSIINEYGVPEAALLGSDDSISLTRAGWSNPFPDLDPDRRVRSTLQRVTYSLDEGVLVRSQWFVLDRISNSESYDAPLLEDVSELKIQYMNEGRNWENIWPPLATISSTGATIPPPPLPLAVKITLELNDWGSITRVFTMLKGWS